MKYFALSDIHGRAVSIEDFVKQGFEVDNPNHMIILLGDYFDRGTQNYEVLRFLEETQKLLGDRFVMLRGNHDEFLMRFLDDIRDYRTGDDLYLNNDNTLLWTSNGGTRTIKELFGSLTTSMTLQKRKRRDRLVKLVSQFKSYYETDKYIFTHAGIDENRMVDTWDRDFFYRGMNTDKTVIIGHTPHPYLGDSVLVNGVAMYDQDTLCDVLNIDNGKGNNIVVFEE